jgi:glycosyltransferase involved in cell wall biosynthesis
LNILVVTQYFDPEPFRIGDLVAGLRERGHSVTVLTGQPNYPEGRFYPGYGWGGPWSEERLGARIVRVPLISRGPTKNWRLVLNYASFALSASLLGPLRCSGPYDLVFVFEPSPVTVGVPGLVLGALRRAPVMLWIQDLWPETLAAMGQRGAGARAAGLLAHWIHRRCDRVLVQSRAFAPRLESSGVSPGRIRYLPNWAEDLYRQPMLAEIPAALRGLDGFKLMFAGNLGSAQSLDTLLGAAERLRARSDILWLIVGDGQERARIASEIERRRLDATVKLLGRHPAAAMPAFFASADVLLVTLRADPVFALTIPSKIQSYLAAARPIIGALNGEGARIIEESGAGIVVPAGNAEALAAAAVRMAGLPVEQRVAMGRSGNAYFHCHFRRDRLIEQLEDWMHELVDKHHAHTDPRR